MKKTLLNKLLPTIVLSSAPMISTLPTLAHAEVSANVGAVTQYIFRGAAQGAGAAAQGGIDYSNKTGIYAGIWGSSMNSTTSQGIEYDLYAGWGKTLNNVDLGIGYTSYNYGGKAGGFGDFKEINLSAGYKLLSVNYDIGTDSTGASDADYKHYAISANYKDFTATYGATKDDASGSKSKDYLDLGYSLSLAKDLDGSFNVIYSGKDNDDTVYMVFGINKSF